MTWSSVPRARLRVVEGAETLRAYTSSPGVRRLFCGRCGSPMLYESDHEPDIVYFTVAHVDGPLTTPVERHYSYEEHVPWIEGVEALPRYRGKSDEPV